MRTRTTATVPCRQVPAMYGSFSVRYALVNDEASETDMLSKLVNSFEKERTALATELHENLAQMLASASMLMSVASHTGQQGLLEESQSILHDAINKIREVRRELSVDNIQLLGLKTTLNILVAEKSNHSDVAIVLSMAFAEAALSFEQKVAVFRIIQAALKNAEQHAIANRVSVNIRQSGQVFSITVEDDGIGFNQRYVPAGGGLAAIKARVDMLHGSYSVLSQPNEGTRLCVKFKTPGVS